MEDVAAGYEYDFISRDRWFVGFVIQAKATDISATLTARVGSEFTRVQAPVPTLGGIARVYVVPNISITGEFLGFRIPEHRRAATSRTISTSICTARSISMITLERRSVIGGWISAT